MSRSAKKGPYVDEKLYKKVSKLNENRAKQPIKTWARACTIIPEFVGHTFEVHNGNKFLRFSKQRASGMVEKVIRSAIANANEQDTAPSRNTFYVAKAWVDPGPVIKRFQPKDRGKAYPINKRTSHLVVTVDDREEGQKAPKMTSVGR